VSRRIDFSGFSPAERAVALCGGILFVNGFIPWWYRIRTPFRTYLHNAGLSGWGLLTVLAGFAAAAAVTFRRRQARSWPDHFLYAGLGIAALAALGAERRSNGHVWIGFYAALAVSLLLIVAALRRSAERRGGWV
jgi:hypothetical protein